MKCYACDQEATESCARCGNSFCPSHGAGPTDAALCAACGDPRNATPSGAVFRTSLFALLIASVLALWLLVRPPGNPGQSRGISRPEPTVEAVSTPVGTVPASPTPALAPSGEAEPSPTASGAPAATTAPEPTAAPTPAPTEPPLREYTVVEGDTWYSIAAEFDVDAAALAAANGRTLDDFVVIGETLVIPR